MRRSIPLIAAFFCIGAWGCDSAAPPEEQAQGPSRADSVGIAMQAFDATVFDTIAWESSNEAIQRGGLVFRISCVKCHGELGAGDGNFVLQGDTLRPPSFLAEEWAFADAPLPLRQYIFSGNAAGMPYWGLVGLKYKDIDAVSRYITENLRAAAGPIGD